MEGISTLASPSQPSFRPKQPIKLAPTLYEFELKLKIILCEIKGEGSFHATSVVHLSFPFNLVRVEAMHVQLQF